MSAQPLAVRASRISSTLREIFGRVLRIEPRSLDVETPFLELGADSLALVEALRGLQEAFGVKLTIRQLFERFPSISTLAAFLEQTLPADSTPPAPPPLAAACPLPLPAAAAPAPPAVAPSPPPPSAGVTVAAAPVGASGMERVLGMQIQAFNQLVAQQLQTLGAHRAPATPSPPRDPAPATVPAPARHAAPSPAPAPPAPPVAEAPAARPVLPTFLGKTAAKPRTLTDQQQRHLDSLVERYCRKTARSKELTQRFRPWLADSRATVGFRTLSKEMLYPLTRARARGSRVWDIDGNEYVDVTMGMGVHLFGHQPDWLQETVERQVREGFELGPRSAHSGEVAALFCELTGMERATFTNSGTEACMTAIRLARARTGRSRIAMFSGSYHGHSDGTLAQTQEVDGELRSFPVAPGIPPGVAKETLVLDYGSERALEFIRRYRDELAAVIVEPIQSRRPDLQPREFLHELRRLTAESGIALIFDEMITGFRLHLGGAQAWFGVRADLATYGKVIGGGLPIGVVAGAADFMDGIDGGMWRYGDDSRPERETTFFGGTFCQHPLAMSAAKTVLGYLKAQGPQLQERLNDRTSRFSARLNGLFAREAVPVRAVHAHSLFRFSFSADAELFFYHLVDNGVYVWEWRNCFLSTAHTDDDLDRVVRAVEESVGELCRGGFFPHRSAPAAATSPASLPAAGSIQPATPPGEQATVQAAGRAAAAVAAAPAVRDPARHPDSGVRFSLYFFGNYPADFEAGKYDLLLEGARFADHHGLTAVWLPERHFHPFGGLSPNPAVLAAALARETERVALRAGSVVLPLHHPVRVAEEWALVDNLSGGRIGLSYAFGWHPNDFALAPDAYGRHRDLTIERAETIRRLWRGEAVPFRDGAGKETDLRIFPSPARREIPVWITVVGNPDTYRLAGEMGAGVLTNLMEQKPEGLAANLEIYRRALAAAGHPSEAGRVTVLLHTFLGPDAGRAVDAARRPFYRYLESSVGLLKNALASEGSPIDFDRLSRDDVEYMLEHAYQRYVQTSALVGSPESVAPIVERLRDAGVDEIACLIDFGMAPDAVRASLPWLAALQERFRSRPRRRPAGELARVPLTEAQRDLYTVAQLGEEASLAYLEPGILELRGALDADLLRRALQEAVNRHEALRSVVPPAGAEGDLVQEVLPEVQVELPLVDATGCTPDRREEVSSSWLVGESLHAFDLARGPLVRASLLRLAPRIHRWGIFVHHIAADGLSIAILIRDALAIYEAERAGCRPVLPQPLQFREYAAWLAAGGAENPGDEAWWLEQMAAPVPVFEPPVDRPRPAVRAFRGARRRRVLEPELLGALRQLGRRQGATLFVTLLGAWAALLHRWTGQDDLVLGGPAARRPVTGGDRLVGHCVDLVPYRSRLAGGPTFAEHLAALRGLAFEAHDHGGYPLSRLLRALRLPHDPGRTPLVNAVFNFDPGAEIAKAGGLEIRERPPAITHVKFDVAFHVVEIRGELVLQADYRTDLFDATTLDRHLQHLVILSAEAAADPSRRVDELPLLSAAERFQLVEEWNATGAAYPRDAPLHELFAMAARRDPRAPSVLWSGPEGEERLSYGELAERAGRLAGRLRGLGVGPEVPVILEMERSPELIVAMLGVLAAGGAYVPIDPADPAERRALLRAECGAALRLARADVAALSGAAGPVAELDGGKVDAACLAYVIYTSGSTGRPKGVAVPHRAVARLVLGTDYVQLGPGDRVAHLSNTAFDAATFEIWGALLTGAAVVVIPPEVVLSPAALGEALRRWRISAAFLTATLFNEVVREAPSALAEVASLLVGGEALTPSWVRDALASRRPGARLLNGYGPTESTTFALTHRVDAALEGQSIPIGRPIANTRGYVMDRFLRPLPVGVAGELCLGGDGLARGYLGRPDRTAERFVPSPFEAGGRLYRTGDLVRWRADGRVEYLGRADAQVKLRGFRVELGEVEAALAVCPGVRECAVVARETSAGERRLAAFVVAAEGESPDPRSFLRERLPPYMVPAELEYLAVLPRTPGGKVDRLALASLRPAEASGAAAPPSGALEEIVAGIWGEVLERRRIGVGESFFDLGGHSLLAGRVLARLRALLGVELSLRAFFGEPTVSGLARQVEAARSTGIVSPPLLRSTAPPARRPLSFAQERLWFLDHLVPGLPLYAIPALYRIRGPLREGVLAAALDELVRRQESLRTVFVAGEDGAPAQELLPLGACPLCRIDLLSLPAGLRQGEAERQIRSEARRPFDLTTGPVLRCLLVSTGEEESLLLLNMHHIASDGWSMGVMVREISAHYRTFAAGRPSLLPEPAVQYGDYAEWQRGWLKGQVLEDQLAYWRERLAGYPGPLELPSDRPRPSVLTYRGSLESWGIEESLAIELGRVGRQRGATLFMVLLAAWKTLLLRYTGSEDVVVGSPVANRSRSEVENLVGFFVNTLVLRTDLAGDPRFQELLERVREGALGAYMHQDLPFEKLVESLAPERSLSHTPLFQVVLALHNSGAPSLDLGAGLSATQGEADTGTSKFFLSLLLEGGAGELSGMAEYSTDLFDRSTVRRLLAHYRTLLAGIVARPERRLSELPWLSAAERSQLVEEWNATDAAYPRDAAIHELFAAAARRDPQAPAVLWSGPEGEESLSYGELAERAERLARRLRLLGVGPEVPVVLEMERSPELIVAMLGVLAAGGAYVPIDPADPAERRAFLRAECGAALRLARADVAALSGAAGPVAELDGGKVDAACLAYVIYTSGSTGRPKGVAVPHRAVARLVLGTDYVQLGPGDRVAHLSNTAFDAATFEIWGALLTGAAAVVIPPEVVLSPAALGEALRRWRISAAFLTATLFNEVVREAPSALSEVKSLLVGGEALTPSRVREALGHRRHGTRLLNAYGPTESTTFALWHRIEAVSAGESIPIGRPIANTRGYVLDRDLRPLPVGVVGELCLGGDGLARGYLGRPDRTAERFVPNPFEPGGRLYRTGDLVRRRGDGRVEYLGRGDAQVKLRGFRVELGEVEAALAGCPGVRECAVVLRESAAGGRRLAAFVVAAEGERPDLRSPLRERLPSYMVPAELEYLAVLPRTPGGKIDRRALALLRPADGAAAHPFPAAGTALEEIVAGVWGEMLERQQIGMSESFFDLGGHSLLAGRVLARLRALLGVELSLREFFGEPTVSGLARQVEAARSTGVVSPPLLRSTAPPARRPLSFAQERLWFLDHLVPGLPLYAIPALYRIEGPLCAGVLAAALAELVRRQEALRTVFVAGDDGVPAQELLPPGGCPLCRIDLLSLPAGLRQGEAERQILSEARRPFDLAAGPTLRCLLVSTGKEESLLLLNMHHIASDGWSMGVMVREISAHYRAFAAGRPSLLSEPAVQYGDYAEWQRGWLKGQVLEDQLAYWRERLAGHSGSLDLPSDRPRPSALTHRGSLESWGIEEGLAVELGRVGRPRGATLFMVLLAAWKTLLLRYTGSEDVVVGSPVANRSRSEVENLVGFFVNTLVLRTDLAGDPPFQELLERVREEALGAYMHQDLPFEKLVESLAPERSLSHTPLFQVVFALHNSPLPALDLGADLSATLGAADSGTSKFFLSLLLEGGAGELSGVVEYNTELFDRSTIRRLLAHYRTLLAGIVARPERRISELPWLSAAERSQLVEEWNATDAAYPRDAAIHELFAAAARRDPQAPAVLWSGPEGEESLSYGELAERAERLARRLRLLGVGPEVPVVLEMERSPELIVAMLGVLAAGGAYVPIDPADPAERRAFLREDCGAALRLARADVAALSGAAGPAAEPDGRVDAACLAYVIYTSGSTGRPKGVAVPHRAVARLVLGTDYVELGPGDRVAHLSNTAFDAATFEIWGALLTGAAVAVIPPEVVLSPAALGEELRCLRISVALPTTALFNEVVREAPSAFSEVEQVLVGGEALSPSRVREELGHRRPGTRLLNAYGPTESTTFALTHRIEAVSAGESIPIGRPIANTRGYVLDRFLRLLPVGVAGELCLGGDGLARGYLGRPDLTAERFVPSPFEPGGRSRSGGSLGARSQLGGSLGARLYRTGDLVRWRADGRVEYLGRGDAQVKLRGFRVELGEVEAVLAGCPGVQECAVVVRESAAGGRRLAAFVVAAEVAEGERPDLRSALRERLPSYMVPAELEYLAALPRMPGGKVDRRALASLRPAEASGGAAHPFPAAGTALEEIVAGVWGEVLELPRIDIGESFFDLGGHSLLAGRVLARLRALLGVELSLRAFFGEPTVSGLARQIEVARSTGIVSPPLLRAAAPPARRPLSFAQERLWFLDHLVPGLPLYAIPVLYRIGGPLREGVLAAALGELVRRQEALRTVFVAGDGASPAQELLPPDACPLCRIDLLSLPAGLRQGEAERQILSEARRPFDLAADLMLRCLLVSTGEEESLLLLNMHHIASDGWSMGVMVREISAHYRAFAAGRPSLLPEPAVQYGDYAEWQRGWLKGQVLEDQLGYWRERLAGHSGSLDLPSDRPRPSELTYRGSLESWGSGESLAVELGRVGRQRGATLFMVLLAAFKTLLLRYTGSEDVVVGSPVANRSRSEVENLVGFFVNTLVLRTDLAGDPPFHELLERVREEALGAYMHQDLPFEKLVESLAPERDLSHTPLFQVLFALQNSPLPVLDLGAEVRVVPGGVDTRTSKFFLSLLLEGGEGALSGVVEYSTELFDRSTIRRLLAHYEALLAGAVARPDRRISELPLLFAPERHQLLVEWNDTRRDHGPEASLHGLMALQAARVPEAVAVTCEGRSLTYGELAARANRLARFLRRLGAGPEERVAIALDRSLELVVGLLGILAAGAAYVPLDPSYPDDRLAFMLDDARPSVLLTGERLGERLARLRPAEGGTVLLRLDADWRAVAAEPASAPAVPSLPEHPAYSIYTSGSTGRPKGAVNTHGAVVNRLLWMRDAYGIDGRDAILQKTPVSFDVSVWELFLPLLAGARLVLARPGGHQESAYLADLMAREGITTAHFVPAMLQVFLAEPRLGPLPALARVIASGEALSFELKERFHARLPAALHNLYGPTEAAVDVTAWPCVPGGDGTVPIGRPVANVWVYVLDRHLSAAPLGAAGELYLGGVQLARGYLGRPDLTAERFLPDPFGGPGERIYRTGDLVRRLPDGALAYLGRVDHQVKLRGFRIELGEVEETLARHPQVREAVVMLREAAPSDRRLVAYAVPAGAAPEPAALREHLRALLPEYMVPSSVVLLDALPLTPNGKVDRQALPAPDRGGAAGAGYVAPRTSTEERLARLWAGILAVDRVGVADDFFDLGGHSLLALHVITHIRAQFGLDLPLGAMFRSSTVERMAALIDGQAEPASSPLVLLGGGEGRGAPFFCVHGVGGNVFRFVHLARASRRPFYGIQGWADLQEVHHLGSVEAMAELYMAEIRRVQPRGPYFLGGVCLGCMIAFEMARRFEAEGETVAFIGLLNTAAGSPPAAILEQFNFESGIADELSIAVSPEAFQRLPREEHLGYVLAEGHRQGVLPAGFTLDDARRYIEVFRLNLTANTRYLTSPAPVRATLFATSDGTVLADPTAGWAAVALRGVEVIDIPGDNASMLRPPHVGVLAERLGLAMDDAEAAVRGGEIQLVSFVPQ